MRGVDKKPGKPTREMPKIICRMCFKGKHASCSSINCICDVCIPEGQDFAK